jgi:flavin reductase (DIM6/NTAB) family NADH-FMN oxidoreductase RutF
MTSLVAPRPIAWVSTLDEQGRANLAPFSYFQAVCSAPPTIVLGIGRRGDGSRKDTLANILATGELTINHVSRAVAEPMNATSADLPHELSEWQQVDIPSVPAKLVAPARVAAALAGFECRMTHAIPLGGGSGQPSSTLVIAEVVHFWVRDGLVQRDERGHLRPIDPAVLDSIGRLGGDSYASTREHFEVPRPKPP